MRSFKLGAQTPCPIPPRRTPRTYLSPFPKCSGHRPKAWLLLAALCQIACGHAAPNASISQTLRGYRHALQANDANKAHSLLSPDQQSRLPLEQFALHWKASEHERAAQLRQLAEAFPTAVPSSSAQGTAGLTRSARLGIRSAGSVPVEILLSTDRQGRFRVAHPELSAPDISTPEAALRGFLSAIEQRSLPAIFRLLSEKTRQAVEEELRERALRLRTALQSGAQRPATPSPAGKTARESATPTEEPRIEVRGNRARIQYDPRFFIDLIREPEGWRIRDMN